MLGWMKTIWAGASTLPSIDRLTYAVGDIHGRRDLLRRLIDAIDADRAGRPAEVIFLGDYIDRGDDSAGVVSDLIAYAARGDVEAVFLKGNHEAALLDFLANPGIGPDWAAFGGRETLFSYAVRPPVDTQDMAAWEACRTALVERLPLSHGNFLKGLDLILERGDYLFVHAGVDPQRPIRDQGEAEFLWIREAFLESSRRLPKIVVHGHTPEDRPVWDRRRIGIDTGAYLTGRLTAVRLLGTAVDFLST